MRKIFRKTNSSYPMTSTRTCAYQSVRNVSFSENSAYVLNELLPIGLILRGNKQKPGNTKPQKIYVNGILKLLQDVNNGVGRVHA